MSLVFSSWLNVIRVEKNLLKMEKKNLIYKSKYKKHEKEIKKNSKEDSGKKTWKNRERNKYTNKIVSVLEIIKYSKKTKEYSIISTSTSKKYYY